MSLNLYRFLYVHVLIETNVFVQTSPLMVQFSIICWGLGVVWPKLSYQILMTFVASLAITDDISETNDSKKFLYSDKIYGYSSISNKLSFGLTTISVEETLSCFSLLDIDLFFFGNRPRWLWFMSKKNFSENFRHSSFVSCLNWK